MVNARRGAYVAIGAVALAGLAFAVHSTSRALASAPGGGQCAYAPATALTAAPGSITLAPRTPAQVVSINLGNGRDPQTASIDFQSNAPLGLSRGTAVSTQIGDFARADGHTYPSPLDAPETGQKLPVTAQAVVTNRTTVRLRVCFDATRPRRADPGTYLGTVAVDDDALASPVLASISLTLKYPDPWGPLALCLLAALCATYLAALAQPASGQFRQWFSDHEHLSAVAFGVAGALAAYGATYLRSDDWGAHGLLDAGELFAAAFTAAAAGITAHAAGKNAGSTSVPKPQQVDLVAAEAARSKAAPTAAR